MTAEPDTTLDVALDAVLARYKIPLFGIGPADADRGDLASDLAAAARAWMQVVMTVTPNIVTPEPIRRGVCTWQANSTVSGYVVTVDCEGERALEFNVGDRAFDAPMLTVTDKGFQRLVSRMEVRHGR